MADTAYDASLTVPVDAVDAGWLVRRLARVLLSRIAIGRLTIQTPTGLRVASAQRAPGPDAVLILHRWRALRALLIGGDVRFGESYMDGDWTTPDLPSLIELAARNAETLNRSIEGHALARLLKRFAHWRNANTKSGSKRNIEYHYDLGNAFYAEWLDPGMSYSSALYPPGVETLDDAQTAKQDRAIALLRIDGPARVLEIGCGWGGLAERIAATTDARVDGLTLSAAQLAFARDRVARTGLADRAAFHLRDYRDETGTYDRIVSIEMLEAVGESYWPSYFAAIRDRLRAGGRAVLQGITIHEDHYDDYRRCTDFIQHYIFPGGMLPTQTEMRRQAEAAGMKVESAEFFGLDYARTLDAWRKRFHAAWSAIEPMGFDTRFRRMWDYYLAYCEGGFRAGAIDVGLYVLAKP